MVKNTLLLSHSTKQPKSGNLLTTEKLPGMNTNTCTQDQGSEQGTPLQFKPAGHIYTGRKVFSQHNFSHEGHQHCKCGFNTHQGYASNALYLYYPIVLQKPQKRTYKLFEMQGPDPSLAYRPNLEMREPKEKEDYRNFEVSEKSFFS